MKCSRKFCLSILAFAMLLSAAGHSLAQATAWLGSRNEGGTVVITPQVEYTVEFSSDCKVWTPGGVVTSLTPIDALWERVCVVDNVGGAQRVVRVRLAAP